MWLLLVVLPFMSAFLFSDFSSPQRMVTAKRIFTQLDSMQFPLQSQVQVPLSQTDLCGWGNYCNTLVFFCSLLTVLSVQKVLFTKDLRLVLIYKINFHYYSNSISDTVWFSRLPTQRCWRFCQTTLMINSQSVLPILSNPSMQATSCSLVANTAGMTSQMSVLKKKN